MADTPARADRRGPLAAHAVVAIDVAPHANRFIFRGSPQAAALCGPAFGCALPMDACQARQDGDRAALWLGPDEWLLLAPGDASPNEAATAIEAAVAAVPHALVDVSHRQVGITLTGRDSAALLNAGCPLDLGLKAFPIDMSTRTVLAKADIILWRQAEDRFRIEVNRSFSPYVLGFLRNADAGER